MARAVSAPRRLLAALLIVAALGYAYAALTHQAAVATPDEAATLARVFAFAMHTLQGAPDPSVDLPLHVPPTFLRFMAKLLLYGAHRHGVLLAMWIVFALALLSATYVLGRHFGGPWAGLFAAALVAGAAPLTTFTAHLTLDLPLAMAVAWANLTLVQAQGMRRIGPTIVFGCLAALACLAKGYAPVYLFFPAFTALFFGGPVGDFNKRGYHNPLLNAGIAAAFAALAISWWYGGALGELTQSLTVQLHAAKTAAPLHIARDVLGPWTTLLLLMGASLAWFYRRSLPGMFELFVWMLVPAFMFVSASAAYDKFLLPVLPAAAAPLGVLLARRFADETRRTKILRAALLALLLAMALWQPGLTLRLQERAPAAQRLLADEANLRAPLVEALNAGAQRIVIVDRGGHRQAPAGWLAYRWFTQFQRVHIVAADADTEHETSVARALDEALPAADVLIEVTDENESSGVHEGFALVYHAAHAWPAGVSGIELWRADAARVAPSP
ncbi:MAG TPA: glycosyltransferase family 39 protein [bacterium]|nr:glycosyltransferase family 39 protein [bacterium]